LILILTNDTFVTQKMIRLFYGVRTTDVFKIKEKIW